jgi:uncharacterized protein (UPF0276 family)
MIPVGLALQPDGAFLELLEGVIRADVDYWEVAPETLWRADEGGALHPNGFHRFFAELGARYRKPFVGHGVGFSMGSASRADVYRKRLWLERLSRDHAVFRFCWLTDHLGASSLAGQAMTLPLALPMTADVARVIRRSLAGLLRIVGDVGVENSVFYFVLGEPLAEPAFLGDVLSQPRTHLLLDLHNVYTMAQNFGFEAEAYLERLDLSKVIEIHLSGGSDSDPSWLPSGRTMQLDAHDSAVPERVWKLFEVFAPRCANLRGVTLERMEGTVGSSDVRGLREEIRRARRTLGGRS